MHKASKIAEFLRTASNDIVIDVFTQGGCYQYHKMLKVVFPNAKAWYDPIDAHVYTEIDGRFFDIRGEHKKGERWVLMDDHKPHFSERAEEWRYEFKKITK